VAEADYDCRPPGVDRPHGFACSLGSPAARLRPTASEPKTNRFFAPSAIMHSSPDPSSLALAALPDDAVLAFNVRAFSADHDCATPIAPAPGPPSEKNAVQQAFTYRRYAPGARELTWSNWIIWRPCGRRYRREIP
jgi:hypothetical protein